jgi:hypothetical protein
MIYLPGLYPVLRFLWGSFKSRFVKSIYNSSLEITARCNLNCPSCFFTEHNTHRELNDTEMLGFLDSLYHRGIVGSVILGGEPMLRPRVVQYACSRFPFTIVFTNGTLGYNGVHPTLFFLSIDGPPDLNDRIRGTGTTDRIRHHLETTTNPRPIIVHTTLYRSLLGNERALCEFVSELPRVQHIMLNCVTENWIHSEESLDPELPTLEERKQLLHTFWTLKKEFPGLLLVNKKTVDNMTPGSKEKLRWSSPNTCHTFGTHEGYNTDGSLRFQCPYTSKTDCTRCGCGGTVLYRATHSMHLPSLFEIAPAYIFPLFSQHLFPSRGLVKN